MWYLWLQCGGINELDIGQGGGDEENHLWQDLQMGFCESDYFTSFKV